MHDFTYMAMCSCQRYGHGFQLAWSEKHTEISQFRCRVGYLNLSGQCINYLVSNRVRDLGFFLERGFVRYCFT